jgi:hypothetical protein
MYITGTIRSFFFPVRKLTEVSIFAVHVGVAFRRADGSKPVSQTTSVSIKFAACPVTGYPNDVLDDNFVGPVTIANLPSWTYNADGCEIAGSTPTICPYDAFFALPTAHYYNSTIGMGLLIDIVASAAEESVNFAAQPILATISYGGDKTIRDYSSKRVLAKLFAVRELPPTPVSPPTQPPELPPVAPPVAAPVAAPVEPPVALPVAAPVAAPANPPLSPSTPPTTEVSQPNLRPTTVPAADGTRLFSLHAIHLAICSFVALLFAL